MGRILLACQLLLATLVSGKAVIAEQAEKYPYMNEAMQTLGQDYAWQAYDTTTNDGYILTMFRIMGDADGQTIEGQGSKGPLLIQHGFLSDSISWFHVSDPDLPALPVRLFQEGFDVWLGNNRGTRHSRKHEELDADLHAGAFWDFSHAEFGAFDVPTMVKTIVQERGTCEKVSYLGHSLGTTQIFYALGHGKYMQPYFAQVVALAPCFIPNTENYISFLTKESYATIAGLLELLDIESLFGPNWDKQKRDLCNVLGNDEEICTLIKEVKFGLLAGGDVYGSSEVGVEQALHLGQLSIEDRFQEYEEEFYLNDLFGIRGNHVKIERINEPPIKFIYVDGDGTCEPKNQRKYASQIPSFYSEDTIYGRDHAYVVGDNDEGFFNLIMKSLSHAPEQLSDANCTKLMNL